MTWIALLGRFVLSDLLVSILAFPTWWYGEGFTSLLRWSGQSLRYRWRAYAIGLWTRSLAVPMYGQTDPLGRAVSVAMRLVVLFGRLLAFGIESVGYAALAFVWLAALPLLTTLLLLSLTQGVFGEWFLQI